jgi:hypothetical protein
MLLLAVATAPAVARATPISALSGVSATFVLELQGRVQAPGVETSDLGLNVVNSRTVDSALDAADATPFTSSADMIGVDESTFSRVDQTTRSAGAEGAFAMTSAAFRRGSDGSSFVFHERDGGASAQISITSLPVAASATSERAIGRDSLFENVTGGPVTFLLAGTFAADAFARYDGSEGDAAAMAEFFLGFSGATSVSYSPLSPFLPSLEENGAGAVADIAFSDTLAQDGVLSLVVSTSAARPGAGAGLTEALAAVSHDFRLTVTLARGETLTVTERLSFGADAAYAPATPVPLPASLPALAAGLAVLAVVRRRRAA